MNVCCFRISKKLNSSLGTWASGKALIMAAEICRFGVGLDMRVSSVCNQRVRTFDVAFEQGWVPGAENSVLSSVSLGISENRLLEGVLCCFLMERTFSTFSPICCFSFIC